MDQPSDSTAATPTTPESKRWSTQVWTARTLALIRLGRPIFLGGGLVMHALGVAAALSTGARLDLGRLILGQVAITATQLMTHYANDYYDVEADRANLTPTNWSGG